MSSEPYASLYSLFPQHVKIITIFLKSGVNLKNTLDTLEKYALVGQPTIRKYINAWNQHKSLGELSLQHHRGKGICSETIPHHAICSAKVKKGRKMYWINRRLLKCLKPVNNCSLPVTSDVIPQTSECTTQTDDLQDELQEMKQSLESLRMQQARIVPYLENVVNEHDEKMIRRFVGEINPRYVQLVEDVVKLETIVKKVKDKTIQCFEFIDKRMAKLEASEQRKVQEQEKAHAALLSRWSFLESVFTRSDIQRKKEIEMSLKRLSLLESKITSSTTTSISTSNEELELKVKSLEEVVKDLQRRETWKLRFSDFQKFIERNGKMPMKNSSDSEEHLLACWVDSQSSMIKQNKLDSWKLNFLKPFLFQKLLKVNQSNVCSL